MQLAILDSNFLTARRNADMLVGHGPSFSSWFLTGVNSGTRGALKNTRIRREKRALSYT